MLDGDIQKLEELGLARHVIVVFLHRERDRVMFDKVRQQKSLGDIDIIFSQVKTQHW